MEEGEFKKRIHENIGVSKRLYIAMKEGVAEACKEHPTEASVIARNPDYWRNLEGMSEYRVILRNNLDAERNQWFAKWFGGERVEG